MTTYKTGNPLGSVSPKDLLDNSENLDRAVNGAALAWKDRFDKSRLSWAGIEERARIDTEEAAEAAAAVATAQAGEYRDEAQQARDDAVAAASASGDFVFVGTYADAVGKLPLPEGTVVEVGRDETHDDSRTRYLVDSSTLKFAVNLDLLRISLAEPRGAGLVGFSQQGAGGVKRTTQDKMRDIVHVRDFGVVGDGTIDDTDAIIKADKAAKEKGAQLVFDPIRYRVRPFSFIGSHIITNGAIFSFDPAAEEFYGTLLLVENSVIDELNIQCSATAHLSGYVVRIDGNSIVGDVTVKSTGARRGEGVYVCGSNTRVGNVSTYDVDRPIQVTSLQRDSTRRPVSNVRVGNIRATNIVRGVMLDGCNDIHVGHITCLGRSPNATALAPGQNAVLIQGVYQYSVGDVYCEDTSESAVRIGGLRNYYTSDGVFGNITAIRPGNNAFKINDGIGSSRTRRITVGTVTAVDIAYPSSPLPNQSAVRISHADDIEIANITAGVEQSTRSALAGIELNDAKNIHVKGMRIDKAGYVAYMSSTNDTDPGAGIVGGNIENFVIDSFVATDLKAGAIAIGFGGSDYEVTGLRVRGFVDAVPPNYVFSHYGKVSTAKTNHIDVEVLGQSGNFDAIYTGEADRADDLLTVRQGVNVFHGNPRNGLFGSLSVQTPTFQTGESKKSGTLMTAPSSASGMGLFGPGVTFGQLNSDRRGAAVVVKQEAGVIRSTGLAFFCGPADAASDNIRERMNLRYDGALVPTADNGQNLGGSNNRWSTVFAGTGMINTSDAREKTQPLPIDDAVLDAWADVNYVAFQWLDMIEQKGTDQARVHFGLIAQHVRDVFERHGLDGTRYGLLCYDEWENEYAPVLDPETGEPTDTQELVRSAGNRWGIRPDQCLFLEAAYQRRELQRLRDKLTAV